MACFSRGFQGIFRAHRGGGAFSQRWSSISRSLSVSSRLNAEFFNSSQEAVWDIGDDTKILAGGFGLVGIPENLIRALRVTGPKFLTVVSNEAGNDEMGLSILIKNHQVKRIICSFIGNCRELEKQYLSGDIEVVLSPQGSLAERIRAGGAGIPAFYTPTGFGTLVHKGEPIKFDDKQHVEIESRGKEHRVFADHHYIMEQSITGDFALVKAWKADKYGNLVFRKSARNFNIPMAKAARCTIAEVEEITDEPLEPENIHLPSIYVQRVVKGERYDKVIERRTTRARGQESTRLTPTNDRERQRDRIVRRAALESAIFPLYS
jgi:3-oxoacid CoA-transferase